MLSVEINKLTSEPKKFTRTMVNSSSYGYGTGIWRVCKDDTSNNRVKDL